MGFRDLQVGQQVGDGLGGHRGAVIGVDVPRPGTAAGDDSVLDEFSGQLTGLGQVHLLVNGLAGEDIDHHVQVEIGAAPGSFQFGDIPCPHLVRPVSDQLGADPRRVRGLGAALTDLVRGAQHPVHAGHRRQVDALIQQDCPHLRRGLVREPVAVQHRQQRLLLLPGQRRRVRCPRGRLAPFRCRPAVTLPVQRGPGFPEQLTRPFHRHDGFEFGDRGVDYRGRFAPESALSESSSKSACAFPTTSSAALVRASSAVSFSFSVFSFSISADSALRAGRPAGFPPGRSPRPCRASSATARYARCTALRGAAALAASRSGRRVPAGCEAGQSRPLVPGRKGQGEGERGTGGWPCLAYGI
jgi:hypothetical protein